VPAPKAIAGLSGPSFGPATLPGGTGSPGGGGALFGTPVASPKGLSIAWDDPAFAENPAWTWIDDPSGSYHVQGFTIDRGRGYEFDRTTTGTARVRLYDTSGAFDPTNATGPFYGKLDPLKQAALAIYNPAATTWSTVFRGFISDWSYLMHQTEKYIGVELLLVDALDTLAAVELVPGGTFGDTVPAGSEGDIFYAQDRNTNAVQTRINKVLNEVGWAAGLRSIFTGNVKLGGSETEDGTVYPNRTAALSVIQDAADAEFPGVANTYVSKDGKVTFHGRLARFNPTDTQYQIDTWLCGDNAAHLAAPTTTAPIVPPLQFARDKEHLYTSAIATPNGVADGDIAAQFVTDAAAKAKYGTRTWSAENLLTGGGAGGTTALVETKKFATYYVENYKAPQTRIEQLSFHAAHTTGARATIEWPLVCGIDIGDRVLLTTTHSGGGGFNTYYFVEGLHYTVSPFNGTHASVELTIDVSPAAHYTTNPFA